MSKYVSFERLKAALPELEKFTHWILEFLSLKQGGVNYETDTEYGSGEQHETGFLNKYFAPPGPPPGKKYYNPFKTPSSEEKGWVRPDYSSKSLQPVRTRARFATGLVHERGTSTFKFKPEIVEIVRGEYPSASEERSSRPRGGSQESGDRKLLPNVFDVIAWIWRAKEFPDNATLEQTVAEFKQEFHLSAEEYTALFRQPDEPEAAFFSDEKIRDLDLIQLLGGRMPHLALPGTEADFLTQVDQYVRVEADLQLPFPFVRRFYQALKTQNFVILTGKPGTGKTQFTLAFIRALRKVLSATEEEITEVFVSVSSETAEVDLLGYENLEGKHVYRDFVARLFDSPYAKGRRGLFFVILDEMNLAHPDKYFARMLPAIESDQRVSMPTREEYLPADTFVIGTANSYLDEPTRLPLSGPIRRRAHVIEMPNYLTDVVRSTEADAFDKCLAGLARQAARRLEQRAVTRGVSFLDEERKRGLQEVAADITKLGQANIDTLKQLCLTLADDPVTSLTMGVVQDVVEYLALSGGHGQELDEAITQKVLPQLRGPVDVIQKLAELLEAKGQVTVESAEYARRLIKHADPVSGEVQPLV